MKRILTLMLASMLALTLVLLFAVACKEPTPEEHDNTQTAQVDATCTTDGVKAYWYCSTCQAYFSDEACTAKIADIDAWKAGDGKIDKLGHTTLVEESAEVAATCTTPGKTAVKGCERCDYTAGGAEIPATGHNAAEIAQVNAACVTDGVKAHWYCSACETYFSDEACTAKIADIAAWKTGDGKIGQLGHTELTEKSAPVAATCTTAGKTAVKGCGRCDYTEGGTEIPAVGHTQTKTPQVDAGTSTDGCKEYWYCDVCQTYFADEACTVVIGDAAALATWKEGDGKIPATNPKPNVPPTKGDDTIKDNFAPKL